MGREMNEFINKIICGGVTRVLRRFSPDSIDCVVTSPPYWALRDYGVEPQVWDGDNKCEHNFKIEENKNPMDRGGKGQHDSGGIAGKMGDKTQTFVKSGFCSKCSAWKGQLGLEPIFELYIKHLCDIFCEVKRVLKNSGTCWVNLGDTYASSPAGNKGIKFDGDGVYGRLMERHTNGGNSNVTPKPRRYKGIVDKSLCMIPFRFAIEMVNRGWILRNTIIWHKPNCMPSSAKDRFTVDFEYVFFFVKSRRYWFEQIFDPLKKSSHQRLNYRFNKNKGDIASAVKTSGIRRFQQRYFNNEIHGRNKRCVWDITTRPFKEAHFAVFPETLVEPMIKAGCPGKGIVLDPFCGSGTTLLMAKKLGRNYIGIDINPEYVKMSKKRIEGCLADCKVKKGEKP